VGVPVTGTPPRGTTVKVVVLIEAALIAMLKVALIVAFKPTLVAP
jgi:hypothetical protein